MTAVLAAGARHIYTHSPYYSSYGSGSGGSLGGDLLLFVIILVVLHLIGGLFHHGRHYAGHGTHPRVSYTYGMGWWGSVGIGGFRIGHAIHPAKILGALVVVALVLVVIARVALHI